PSPHRLLYSLPMLVHHFPLFFSSFFFFYCSCPHRDLHSFPTRRSSDLRSNSNGGPPWICSSRVGLRKNMRGKRSRCLKLEINEGDRKSTRLNSSHQIISYAVFCLKKKKQQTNDMKSDETINNERRQTTM